MADEPDNLVLQLLREMRADIAALKGDMQSLKQSVRNLDDRMNTVEESAAVTIGYLVQANLRDNRHGRDIGMLSNRVTVIEQHVGLTPQQ